MNEFSTLFHSSLSCAGSEVTHSMLMAFFADTLAHIGIAGIVSSFIIIRNWPLWLFWLGLALICAKELAFDLPNASFAPAVIFDSAWDVLSWFVGFFAQWFALANAGEQQ